MNLATVSMILGVLMPALVATVVHERWPAWLKEVTALGLSAVVGLATAWLSGQLHGIGWLEAVVIVAGSSEAAYRLYWKNSDIGILLEQWWPWAAKVVAAVEPAASTPATETSTPATK